MRQNLVDIHFAAEAVADIERALDTLDARLAELIALTPRQRQRITIACFPPAYLKQLAESVQASGDPAIGLRVSRFVSPTTFHALGYALVASGSLRCKWRRLWGWA